MDGRERIVPHRGLFSLSVVLCALIISYLFCYAYQSSGLTSLANQVLPVVLLLSLAGAGFWVVRFNPSMVLSPLPWFFLGCGIQYGFGPLVYYFGNEESVWYLNEYYRINEKDILDTNLLNVVGAFFVVSGFLLGTKALGKAKSYQEIVYDENQVKYATIFLLIVGVTAKLLFCLPYIFGKPSFTLPGVVLQLGEFSTVALIPLTYLSAKGHKKWHYLLILMIVFEIAVSVATFSKLNILMVLIVILIGRFLFYSVRLRFFVFGFTIMIGLYLLITPIVSSVRLMLSEPVGVSNRLSIFYAAIQADSEKETDNTSGIQFWWTRLALTSPQSFAMRAYDNGIRGNSFNLAVYTIIPRFFWPEKPIMTIGPDFDEMVTGNRGSASCPGYFAEAYWNGGWLLLILSCSYVGGLFACFTRYSIRHLKAGKLEYLPVMFIGLQMGFRPEIWFVASFVSAVLLAIGYHYIICFSIKFFFGKYLSWHRLVNRSEKYGGSLAGPE